MSKIDYSKLSYDEQLGYKKQNLTSLMSPFYTQELDVFPSPAKHYRMRTEFRIWHDGADTFHIMFNKETKEKYRVDQLDSASELINQAMLVVINSVKASPSLRTKLFQIDYLSSTTQQLVISLLYHKQLDDEWEAQAELLRKELSSLGDINIIGRARKQKRVVGNDYVQESLVIGERVFTFKQVENSFTQPNAFINVKMIEWVIENASDSENDLLELYCGAGNFSIPLSHHYRQVLATEISKTSVYAAQDNIKDNSISNLHIARLSSEEFAQAYTKQREFNRLKNIDLDSYQVSTILVDPPRSGLDPATIALVSQFETIIYISCNPTTLIENLEQLTLTHEVKVAAMFDQFPFTEHLESGVILRKRQK